MDNNIKSSFIRKRNDNYNVYVEYLDEYGKLKQKSIAKYSNKKEAEKHLIDLKSSINNNKFIISKDITVVDRCYKYIEDNKQDWSPHTILTRTKQMKYNIIPFFGDVKLSDLTVYQVQMFCNYLYNNFATESAKNRYGFLRAVLRDCYRLREIQENLCDFVKTPKKKSQTVADVYTKEELLELFDKLKGQYIELPILLIVLLGLRKSECYGLTWDNIDFENNTVEIEKILVDINKEVFFKEPKTEGSKRTLSVPMELIEKLKKEKLWQNEMKLKRLITNDMNLVCLNKKLEPYKELDLNRYFNKFCKENNIKQIRIHDLRHTNATLMLLSGTDMKTVSNRLGHADIKITMNRYSHVLEEMDRKASDNLSKLLFK